MKNKWQCWEQNPNPRVLPNCTLNSALQNPFHQWQHTSGFTNDCLTCSDLFDSSSPLLVPPSMQVHLSVIPTMVSGHHDRKSANHSTLHRIFALTSPTYFCTNSDPITLMKQASVLLATARAQSVLPVPGGPNKSTPFGGSIPRLTNLSGCNSGKQKARLCANKN